MEYLEIQENIWNFVLMLINIIKRMLSVCKWSIASQAQKGTKFQLEWFCEH